MTPEIELFHLNGVLITDRRFSAGGRSFAVRDIVSVRLVKHASAWLPSAALAVMASCVLYGAAVAHDLTLWLAALSFFVLAAGLLYASRRRYSLLVETTHGLMTPLVCRDRLFTEGVAATLHYAMERCGVTVDAAEPEVGRRPMQAATLAFVRKSAAGL